VFKLVKYRYAFLIVSLVIIIPGLISLFTHGLDLGIDFAGGSIIELQQQSTVKSTNDVQNWLKPLNLQAMTVSLGNNKQTQPDKLVYIHLNTWIDTNVETAIQTALQNKFSGVNVKFADIPVNGKTTTLVAVTSFKTTPKISDIQSALSNLPKTSDPSKGAPAPVAATPTAQPTVAATGTPSANSTPAATATPAATSTPAAASTPTVAPNSANTATIPVSVTDIKQGTTTQTIDIQTKSSIQSQDIPRLQGAIVAAGGPYTMLNSNSEVGPSVASETTRNAFFAVLVASALILLYIWFSFRKVPKSWRYGACAIIALLHDVLVLLGVFSILGWLLGVQVDSLFLTAVLTVVGFSVHDTIVVFDRIRENMQRSTSETFEQVVDASLVQTMSRSLNTSLTVLFTLATLTLFTQPGSSVHNFTLALLIGIFSGTYSSIFNASMMLVIWEKGELGLNRLSNNRDLPPGRRERSGRELARTKG
jgi:preprotein translocase SecF subunit